MANRRKFLQSLSSLPLVGGLFPVAAASAAARPTTPDYFKDLGVKPFINAAGTYTALSASLMSRETMQAMDYASRKFYRLGDVQDAVGARIASLIGAEAAMVTSGAAGAIACGTAACITGKDRAAIEKLPDTTGLKDHVIIQKGHRIGYDHSVRATGAKLIEIESMDELERAANDRTAMLVFFNTKEPDGKISSADWVAFGKKRGIPTFSDCSADVPPVENLMKFAKSGFDLVTVSGGKGLCGPQSAGMLFGRKDLIEAARMNTSPNSDSIGRGMKVNKEEMLGMLVALEQFLKRDHKAEWTEWERRIAVINKALAGVPGITSETFVPPIANHVPHLRLTWDFQKSGVTPVQILKRLRAGDPSIELNPDTNAERLIVGVWMLQPGEAEVVAKQLKAAFTA
ncbi:MAG TPA: selenocysteine synthase [Bryobacteraceae bacterium]